MKRQVSGKPLRVHRLFAQPCRKPFKKCVIHMGAVLLWLILKNRRLTTVTTVVRLTAYLQAELRAAFNAVRNKQRRKDKKNQ